LGSKVITFKNNNDFTTKIVTLGVPDKFIGHGNVETLYEECGYDTKSIISHINKYYSKIN
jgi:1-deoxy-D-xylulose-5-phosphate synthase